MKPIILKNKKIIWIGLLLLILVRLLLTFTPAHTDVRIQTEWAKWMYDQNLVRGLYNHNVWGCIWPNHPPLISWIYFQAYKIHSGSMWFLSNLGNFIALNRLAPTKFIWLFNFTKWFGEARYDSTEYLIGVMVVIKQMMILADLGIAFLIYKVAKKYNKNWKKYVWAYLLLPFSWYLSAVWGQSNSLSFVFLILSFILLADKRVVWSPLFYAISLNLKPDSIILLPIYLFIWFKNKKGWSNLLLGGLLAVIFTLWTVSWFNKGSIWDLILLLIKRLNTNEGNLVTLNAFNFWQFLFPFPTKIFSDMDKILFLPAKIWGIIFWIGTSFLSMKLVKKNDLKTIFLSMFCLGFGSWLFMTGMHERYIFIPLVCLLFYSIYNKNYFKYFVVLSIIFFLTMFYVFSIPDEWQIIKVLFNWNGQIVTRLLSLINLFIYFKILYLEFFKTKK